MSARKPSTTRKRAASKAIDAYLAEKRIIVKKTYHYDTDTDMSKENSTGTGFSQWAIRDNGKFVPSFPTVTQLPAGFYEVKYDHNMGVHMVLKTVNSDELYELPSTEIGDIIEDIKKFWDNVGRYKQYNFVHKRGILLYGDPGAGKSGIIQLCTKHLINEMNGIVINLTDLEAIEYYDEFISDLRAIEPTRPIIVILEDVDALAKEDRSSTSLVLNLLDGVKQIDNIVYIATTNYPEKLEERITNRPSRFDRRYEVKMPNDEVREAYLRNKLTDDDLKSIKINDWVKHTKGMSLAHMRELVISVMTMGNTFESTIERLTGLKIKPRIKKQGSEIGFMAKD